MYEEGRRLTIQLGVSWNVRLMGDHFKRLVGTGLLGKKKENPKTVETEDSDRDHGMPTMVLLKHE